MPGRGNSPGRGDLRSDPVFIEAAGGGHKKDDAVAGFVFPDEERRVAWQRASESAAKWGGRSLPHRRGPMARRFPSVAFSL